MASARSDKRRDQHQVIDLPRTRPITSRTLHRTPANTPTRTNNGSGRHDEREAARQAYRESMAAGQRLSGRELADRYGYSRSWGRDRINEVRADAALAAGVEPALDHAINANRDAVQVHPENCPELCDENTVQPNDERNGQRQTDHGRRVAWLAFVVGIAASVAANVMHAQIVSRSPAAWIGAAFWPISLLLAIEVLARVTWPPTSLWYRLARHAGASLVAIVAAVLSYRHMAGLLAAWGEDKLSAYLGPLAVDGLMILAAAALLINGTASLDEYRRRGPS